MSPHKIPYDGPKTFEAITKEISNKLGYDHKMVKMAVKHFFYIAIFRKLSEGKMFSLRGIGKFLPWKITQLRVARGQLLPKHNVDGTKRGLNRKIYENMPSRVAKRKKSIESIGDSGVLRSGWD